MAMQQERINRYLPVSRHNRELAFQYYLWNCTLSESFYFSLHCAEVVSRNALHNGLLKRAGEHWFRDRVFCGILDVQYQNELKSAEAKESLQHRGRLTAHHVVSALTFGFWEHLTTKRFERYLWAKGIRNVFPNAPTEMTLVEVHNLIESVRRWRNRIAHHRAIFDKGPMKKHSEALSLISITCSETSSWVASVSKVPSAIALRPELKTR